MYKYTVVGHENTDMMSQYTNRQTHFTLTWLQNFNADNWLIKQRVLMRLWRLWDRASIEQRYKQQTRCNKFRLLILLLIFLTWVSGDKLTHLYIQSKSAPEDGWVCRPKRVEQIKKIKKMINKRNLLHLVGCLHRCLMWTIQFSSKSSMWRHNKTGENYSKSISEGVCYWLSCG